MSSRRIVQPLAAIALGLVLSATPALAQRSPRPLSGARVAAQVTGGALTMPLAFIGGGLATRWVAGRLGATENQASRVAYLGAWSAAALATAGVPALIGARGPGTGSYAAALAGTLAGGIASYGLIRLNRRGDEDERRPCRLGCIVSAAGVFLLPSIGATVGFNLSRRTTRD